MRSCCKCHLEVQRICKKYGLQDEFYELKWCELVDEILMAKIMNDIEKIQPLPLGDK